MNRKQRVRMIVQVLLMPFTRAPFDSRDPLLEKVQAYRKLLHSTSMYHGSEEFAYQKAQDALVESIEAETKPDRLSELGELLEMFYPEDKLDSYLGPWEESPICNYKKSSNSGLEEYYLNMLLRLSTEFITLRDGRVSIKMWDSPSTTGEFFPNSSGLYKVELWSEISRIITPDVLIAAYFVQCGIFSPEYLRGLPDNIFLSDSLLARLNSKGIAETHLHLSAGMSYLSVWEAVTDPIAMRVTPHKTFSSYQKHQAEEQQANRSLIVAGWLRLIMAKYLTDGQYASVDLPEYYFNAPNSRDGHELEVKILRHILNGESTQNDLNDLLEMLAKEGSQHIATVYTDYGINQESKALDVLMRGPFCQYHCLNTAPEILLLFFALCHVNKFPLHSGFQRVFLCYLRIKNSYFSNKLQSTGTSGLTFFHRYFNNAASAMYNRKGEDIQKSHLVYRAAFLNQFHCVDLKKLEVKISPPRPSQKSGDTNTKEYRLTMIRQLSGLFGVYRDLLLERDKEQGRSPDAPTLGIVYHLIRKNIHHSPGNMCWAMDTSSGPMDLVSHLRRECEQFVQALQYFLRTVPHLSEYVVGLDVASEEIYTEPWVYAPVYRKARNRMTTYPIQLNSGQAMQNLGLTYHVGEDYHHVISGLRHIDEVLTYFGYKAGDRLGHGLALQIDMAEWMHNNEIVSLPIMEYLENLLWLWSLCSEDAKNLIEYLPELEKEIMCLAEKIYVNTKGITPQVLWKAYIRKFEPLDIPFCAQMEKMYLRDTDEHGHQVAPIQYDGQRSFCARTWQMLDRSQCALPYVDSVWDADKLLLTHYCPVYIHHYRQPYFTSNVSKKLPLYKAVQVYMRGKVQRMGIFVETNPTSNLIIGDIRGLHDYPITDLNNCLLSENKSASVLISVNSDDPLLFNTNVENELALVYHTLVYRGISREEVLTWIGKVRQYGMDSSFIRQLKSTQKQAGELDEIITRLESLRNDIIEGSVDF